MVRAFKEAVMRVALAGLVVLLFEYAACTVENDVYDGPCDQLLRCVAVAEPGKLSLKAAGIRNFLVGHWQSPFDKSDWRPPRNNDDQLRFVQCPDE